MSECVKTREALIKSCDDFPTHQLVAIARQLEKDLSEVAPEVHGSDHPCATDAVAHLTAAIAALADATAHFENAIASCREYSAIL